MPKIICTVPEAGISKDQIRETEAAFTNIYARHFGPTRKPTMLWTLAPAGQTFQAGEPADIYLALIGVENNLDQDRREAAMWDFIRAWAKILGLDIERLMVTAADHDTVTEYLRGNKARLRPRSRPWFLISTILHILRSRSRDGYAALRANL